MRAVALGPGPEPRGWGERLLRGGGAVPMAVGGRGTGSPSPWSPTAAFCTWMVCVGSCTCQHFLGRAGRSGFLEAEAQHLPFPGAPASPAVACG